MPSTSPVILILGAGPNIGQHVARAFAAKGYKVALAARRLKEADNTDDQVNIPSDFSDPNAVVDAFAKVRKSLGVPSVVVYNGKNRCQDFVECILKFQSWCRNTQSSE
jgi:NAD(P)-dependent dehydrogenase (short-subunit alcohol dehydrogenase family)